MHTLPRNSAGHTFFLFFASSTRSKSALCHLLCEATCSLGTDKQQGNVTSVVEYSKIVTVQPGGVLPYMGYIGMCGPKGYGFSAVLVINRVSILADFGHFGHK